MGRIITANMAFIKRQAAEREKRGNVFEKIEKTNEGRTSQ